jgi:hypothetical protein
MKKNKESNYNKLNINSFKSNFDLEYIEADKKYSFCLSVSTYNKGVFSVSENKRIIKYMHTFEAFNLINKFNKKTKVLNLIKFIFLKEENKMVFLIKCGFRHKQIIIDKNGKELSHEEFENEDIGCMCDYSITSYYYFDL